MANDLVYVTQIANEIQRIINSDVKSVIGLSNPGAHVGEVFLVPPEALTSLVDGVWIHPVTTQNEAVQMPRDLLQTYTFRLVYVRKMGVNENPTKVDGTNMGVIVNKIMDQFNLPSISGLPAQAQVLWAMWKTTEWQPSEDAYVSRVRADFKASASMIEVKVRTART